MAPRLEIDLDKIYHNAGVLVTRLVERGVSVTGVTKAALGAEELASTLVQAGVTALGDSRIENIKRMRLAGNDDFTQMVPMTLLREHRNLWGTMTSSFEPAVFGRCSIFVEFGHPPNEYLLNQNSASGCQSHDLAQAAGPWKHLNGRSSSYHSNSHELGQ